MTLVVILALVLLITVLATFLIIENNRKKAEEFKRKLYKERHQATLDYYKRQLEHYVSLKLIRPKHITYFEAISRNFFVVQPKTDENLELLEGTLERLCNAINAQVAIANEASLREALALQLIKFIHSLPSTGREYNTHFYTEFLPSLIIETISTPLAIKEQSAEQPLDDTVEA